MFLMFLCMVYLSRAVAAERRRGRSEKAALCRAKRRGAQGDRACFDRSQRRTHALSSNKMALITSDCCTKCSLSIKWP